MWISWMLFGLRGRIRRRDWWVGQLLLGVVGGVALAPALTRGGEAPLPPAAIGLMLLLTWPSVALGVKREHDRDRSGWVPLLLIVGGAVLGFIPSLSPWIDWPLTVLQLAGTIYLIVTLGVLDGTAGDNRFGPSPKRFDPPDL